MSSLQYKNYSVVVSLGERVIYLKLSDQVNFFTYEGTVDAKELKLQFDLEDISQLIWDCFQQEEVTISVNNGFMKLGFRTKVGGFLKVNFECILKEKVFSNDGKLTTTMNRMESQLRLLSDGLAALTEELLKKNELLSHAEICFWSGNHTLSVSHWIKIGSEEISLHNAQGQINFDKLRFLYRLRKLNVNSYNGTALVNDSLEELEIVGNFSTLDIKGLPNLKKLTVKSAPSLANVVASLTAAKHQIKSLTFQGCSAINVVELQTYCQTNKIELNIS